MTTFKHLARFLGVVALIAVICLVIVGYPEQVMAILAVGCVVSFVGCVVGLVWIWTKP